MTHRRLALGKKPNPARGACSFFVGDLLAIDGVPKTPCAVEGDRVFVFRKLMSLVGRSMRPGVDLGDLSRSLVPSARVSPLEAVRQWGVTPKPFVGGMHPGGLYAIRHKAFDAWLPGRYRRELDMHRALADLLMGKVLQGEGDFVHKVQAMSLCEPLDVSRLAPRPPALSVEPPAERGHARLRHATFLPGFAPLSEALFQKVQALDSTWASWWSHASGLAVSHAPTLWAMVPTLDLRAINGDFRLPVDGRHANVQAALAEGRAPMAHWRDLDRLCTRVNDALRFLGGDGRWRSTPHAAGAVERVSSNGVGPAKL